MDDRCISRFWENYIAKLKTYGIKPNMVRWHVSRVAQYIHTFPDRRLATHTVQDVEQYLQDKGRKAGLNDGQFQKKPSQNEARGAWGAPRPRPRNRQSAINPVCTPASPHRAPSA